MLAERRALKQRELAKVEQLRMREILAAFAEGARAGTEWIDPDEAWASSKAQRRLNPPVRSGEAAKRWQHEQKLIAGTWHDEAYAERWRRRCGQVRLAFEEGHWAGACGYVLREAWQHSRTRRSLYPGPPTPLHLATRALALGYPIDDRRRPGGPGDGR